MRRPGSPLLLVALLAGAGGTAVLGVPGVPPGAASEDARLAPQVVAVLSLEREPPVPEWRVATRIADATSRPAVPFRAFTSQALQWGDLDGDGRPEVLTSNTNGRLYVFDPEGAVRAEVPWPKADAYRPAEGAQPSAAVADLDEDGALEVYVVGNEGTLARHDIVRGAAPGQPMLRWVWEKCLDCRQGEFDGSPWAAAGMVFAQHDGAPHQWGLHPNGSMAWESLRFDGNAGPVAADLDGDGDLEVVFATDAGAVVARDAATGDPEWERYLAAEVGVAPGSIPHTPTVADLDFDGRAEVAVAMRNASGGAPRGGAAVFALLGHDGALRWTSSVPGGNPMSATPPAPFDVDNDGVRDLVWLDWNTLGHSPGGFERLGPAFLSLLDGRDGRVRWRAALDSAWSSLELALADVDGDGGPEVVVPERYDGREGIGVRSILDGRLEAWWPAPEGWSVARGVAAVDWRGTVHLLVALGQPHVREGVQEPAGSSPTGQLLLLDTGRAGAVPWPGTSLRAS